MSKHNLSHLDITTKKCVISDECDSSNNNYLLMDYDDITDPLSSLFQSETKLEGSQQLNWVNVYVWNSLLITLSFLFYIYLLNNM